MKRFMEAALGNASDVIRCGASLCARARPRVVRAARREGGVARCVRREHQMKFFEHDGAVLRFYLCWDDRSVLAGDKLIYRVRASRRVARRGWRALDAPRAQLHYFLANDTCEIMETRAPNDGRPSFPVFLKRQPVRARRAPGQMGSAGRDVRPLPPSSRPPPSSPRASSQSGLSSRMTVHTRSRMTTVCACGGGWDQRRWVV